MAFKGTILPIPTDAPKPPQPGFSEKPKPRIEKFKENFHKHKLFILIGGVVFFILVAVILFPQKHTPSVSSFGREDKPQVMSREAVDRAIEQSNTSGKETQVKAITRRNLQKPKDRNYATDIAVFIYSEEKALSSERQAASGKKTAPLGLPSGTRIPAILSNRIFSFNVEAPVIAVIERDFKWKDKVVIPKGTKFFGEASVLKSMDRINVSFRRLIFPDGRQINVQAMILSPDGSGGIKGKVQKHRDVKALKAIGETLLGGASLFVSGARRDPYSLEDQMRYNLAQNLTSQAAQDLREVRVDQSITAESGVPVDVMLLEAI